LLSKRKKLKLSCERCKSKLSRGNSRRRSRRNARKLLSAKPRKRKPSLLLSAGSLRRFVNASVNCSFNWRA